MGDVGAGNGAKAFAGILVIIAIVAGMYSIFRPMELRINSLQSQIEVLNTQLFELAAHEREDQGRFATNDERFKETETQFSNLETRISTIEAWRIWWNRNILVDYGKIREQVRGLEQRCSPSQ